MVDNVAGLVIASSYMDATWEDLLFLLCFIGACIIIALTLKYIIKREEKERHN